jgi:hypothetical protein
MERSLLNDTLQFDVPNNPDYFTDGLTEEAITAARQTKFKPAMKDGKPVPFWAGLEISFNIR